MHRQSRFNPLIRTTAVVVMLVLLSQPVLADTVMLRSGLQVHGTIANREQYRIPMPRIESVSILATDSSGTSRELRRFAADSVEAVVIELDGRTTVYDLTKAPAASPTPRAPVTTITQRGISEFTTTEGGDSGHGDAAIATIVGIAAFTLGVAVKFGGPKAEFTSGGFTVQEHTYNAANYSLMGMGLALGVIGLVATSSSSAPSSEPASLHTPSAEQRLAVQVRF